MTSPKNWAPGLNGRSGNTGCIVNDSGRGARRVTLEPGILAYALKRVLLGKPLITAQARQERLSKKTALGVLSPDAISSSAYGPEQILVALLPAAGLAAFTLVLPITGAILLILILVTASYRQVVMAYTRADPMWWRGRISVPV